MKSTSIYTPTIILMAVAAGICSGSNYFSQPLIHSMSVALHAPETSVSWIPTVAQISYASGLLLLMPLGDLLEKRKLLLILMLLSAVGLLISGLSTQVGFIILGTTITGLFSISAQLMLPLAASLVPIHQSGRVVGFLISGLIIGILLARTLSGLLSSLYYWNTIYLISGSLLFCIAIIVYISIPSFPAVISENYFKTIRSIPVLFKQDQRLRNRTAIGFFSFASISMTFTTMSLLLAPAPYFFNDFQVGLFGLVGIVGTVIANLSGRYIDRGDIHWISILSGCTLIISWICLGAIQVSFWLYILGTILIYSSLSAVHVANQSIVFQLNPKLKSRFNAIYMTGYFGGGAIGTSCGSYAWRHYGWHGVCALGIIFAVLCLYFCIKDARFTTQLKTNIHS